MATPQQKLPKGPSNSSGFGTPGTQQTAQKNVKTGGFDPNMPKGPQAARQARSSYQQSLGAQAGVPGAPASGYSLFSGMPTQQALGLNRSLGLSNLGPMGGGTPPPQARGNLPGTTPPLPPSGGQGATAPRGTASVLHEDMADLGLSGRGFPGSGLEVTPGEAAAPFTPRSIDQRAAGVVAPRGTGDAVGDEFGWESAPLPPSLGRRPGGADVASADFLPPEQELATGDATTTEDMVWGMLSGGTMTANQAMNALGMTPDEYKAWFNEKSASGVKTEGLVIQSPDGTLTDEEGNVLRYGSSPIASQDIPGISGEGAPRGDASDLEAQAAFGAQFYGDPDKMMGLATNNVLRKDKPGYEDEKVQEVKNNLAKQAEIAYQQNLDQLMRQFAVMGTAGSGAFMMANNNLAVQIYGKLLDEYAQIDLKNLDQIEIDLQQEVQNLLAISQMGYANEEDFYETLKKIDENLFMTFTGFLEAMDLTDDQNGQWFQALAEFYEDNWNKVVSGEMTEEEFTQAGMGLLSGKIGEFNLTDEQAAGAWDAMDEHYASQADPSSPKPDDVEPPWTDGTHAGHFKENDGHIWKWNEDTQRWEWQGKQK